MEEQMKSHIKQITGKLKGDKKMKQRKRDPGSGFSYSRSNISREMRGLVPKIANFLAIRSHNNEDQTDLARELVFPVQSASSSALQHKEPASSTMQGKRTSDRNHRSPSYYGFNNSSSDSAIAAPSKRPRRAGDVENFQPPVASVVETVQNIGVQQREEISISPVIGEILPPAQLVQSVIDRETPTLVRSMIILEAENQEISK